MTLLVQGHPRSLILAPIETLPIDLQIVTLDQYCCVSDISELAARNVAYAESHFLADRTNGRAYATVLRLSVVCDVMYCG